MDNQEFESRVQRDGAGRFVNKSAGEPSDGTSALHPLPHDDVEYGPNTTAVNELFERISGMGSGDWARALTEHHCRDWAVSRDGKGSDFAPRDHMLSWSAAIVAEEDALRADRYTDVLALESRAWDVAKRAHEKNAPLMDHHPLAQNMLNFYSVTKNAAVAFALRDVLDQRVYNSLTGPVEKMLRRR